MQSIQEFGFTNPVLIDENNVLIAGHGRTCAARTMGMTEVPAIRLTGLSETQRKALRIADNQLALNAGWDEELLKIELSELQDVDFDLDLLGFDMAELDDILQGLGLEPEPEQYREVEEDEPPTTNVQARCKRGDIWQLGKHRLMCGDSTSVADVKRLMNGQQADMVFTDPPYNVNYQGRGKQNKLGHIKNDNMTEDGFNEFCNKFFNCYRDSLKNLGCIYVCHPDSASAPKIAFETNFAKYFKKASTIIWVKQSAGMGWQDYRAQHEPIIYGWLGGNGKHFFCGDRTKTTVWSVNRDNVADYVHPTQKPVGLAAEAINNSSKPEEIVLDLFGGSGSTLIASEQLNRQCYMMELDEHYCDVIIQRWEDLTGNTAKRITPATCAS